MPLDPQIQQMLDAIDAGPDRKETHEMEPAEAREGYRALGSLLGKGPEVGEVSDRSIPGPDGEIPVRIYQPVGSGERGVTVFFHGGGWVIGDLDTHDKECRILCSEADCVVVAVDYRLAPEHRFPAAVEDSTAAYQWVCEHAAELGAAPGRVAVAGDSAGGNLAAVVAQWARDHDVTPPRIQVLVYPAVDLREGIDYPSRVENAAGPFLLTATVDYFLAHYMGDAASGPLEPTASPLLGDLAGLPPALVVTAEYDPIRDQGEAYARALEEAGVEVSLHRYDGMPHIFFQLGPAFAASRELLSECAGALRAALK